MIEATYEILETASKQVTCDGGKGALGHPRVYLHIEDDTGKVVCPYCSRTYVYQSAAA